METGRIRLDPEIMNYVDRKSGYDFQESLVKRRHELQEVIRNFGVVIWPLIVKDENIQLVGWVLSLCYTQSG